MKQSKSECIMLLCALWCDSWSVSPDITDDYGQYSVDGVGGWLEQILKTKVWLDGICICDCNYDVG